MSGPAAYPPGPRDWTGGFRLLARVKRDVLGFYRQMHAEFGDCVSMRLGPYRDFLFYHQDQIKEVLVTKAKSFRRMPWQLKVLSQWNGQGLIVAEGQPWLRQRRLVQPAFSFKRFDGYAQQMVTQTERLAERWGAGGELRIDREMTDLTLAIITRVFFGRDASAQAREIATAVELLSDVAVREFQNPLTPPRWLPLPSVRRKWAAVRLLDEFIRGVIRQRREEDNPDRGDLLSMLLLAVDEEGDGGPMTDEQARDEAMVLFLAGHDTTAAGLVWVWHVLAKHPETQSRLRDELKQALGNRPATPAALAQVPLLERVIKEALRLYPPAVGVFTRQATETVEIGSWRLLPGNLVRIFSFVTHRDPRWFPDPDRFDPERWTPERAAGLPQFAYFPFGGGPRVCIGREFALMEMGLVVATLLRRFEASPAPGQGEPELLPHLSLRPKGGLRLAVRAAEE